MSPMKEVTPLSSVKVKAVRLPDYRSKPDEDLLLSVAYQGVECLKLLKHALSNPETASAAFILAEDYERIITRELRTLEKRGFARTRTNALAHAGGDGGVAYPPSDP